MSDISNFIPRADGVYATMLVQLSHCATCGLPMVVRPSNSGVFPHWHVVSFNAQLGRAGFVEQSNLTHMNKNICVVCAAVGKAAFRCDLCGQERTVDLRQESFGDPPSHLCKICYNTVTASVWAKKVDELHEAHRYDFQ